MRLLRSYVDLLYVMPQIQGNCGLLVSIPIALTTFDERGRLSSTVDVRFLVDTLLHAN
jgi:hypothetical protein